MGSDGTNNPPFERDDLDMRNPVDREILRGLRRARAERLAAEVYTRKLDAMGAEYEQKQRPKDRGRGR